MSKTLLDRTGEPIAAGDHIEYAQEPGRILLVVTEACGDPELDYYLSLEASGGFLMEVRRFGAIFLPEADEDLDFVARQDGLGGGSS